MTTLEGIVVNHINKTVGQRGGKLLVELNDLRTAAAERDELRAKLAAYWAEGKVLVDRMAWEEGQFAINVANAAKRCRNNDNSAIDATNNVESLDYCLQQWQSSKNKRKAHESRLTTQSRGEGEHVEGLDTSSECVEKTAENRHDEPARCDGYECTRRSPCEVCAEKLKPSDHYGVSGVAGDINVGGKKDLAKPQVHFKKGHKFVIEATDDGFKITDHGENAHDAQEKGEM